MINVIVKHLFKCELYLALGVCLNFISIAPVIREIKPVTMREKNA
jgi:hypothetical protein